MEEERKSKERHFIIYPNNRCQNLSKFTEHQHLENLHLTMTVGRLWSLVRSLPQHLMSVNR